MFWAMVFYWAVAIAAVRGECHVKCINTNSPVLQCHQQKNHIQCISFGNTHTKKLQLQLIKINKFHAKFRTQTVQQKNDN